MVWVAGLLGCWVASKRHVAYAGTHSWRLLCLEGRGCILLFSFIQPRLGGGGLACWIFLTDGSCCGGGGDGGGCVVEPFGRLGMGG